VLFCCRLYFVGFGYNSDKGRNDSGLYNVNQRNDMHGLGIDDLLIVRWDVQEQTSIPATTFGGAPL
jgi:hypothetical protein